MRRHHVDVPLATLLKAVGWTPSDSSIGLDGRHIEETPEGEADEDLSRRCFRTAIYEPGDWGLHGVDDASEPGGDFDIRGWLARAEKVAAAAAGAGDQPLRDYVVARKTCYETIHHLFGERGVAFARRSFASPAHQGAVRRLRERLGDPRWAASLPPVERAEAPLLAAAPDDFVSCVARDGVAGRRG